MSDLSEGERLNNLGRRIQLAKQGAVDGKPKLSDHHSESHLAWRMVIELVVGLGIGFGIGYGLDIIFDTIPLFLVIFVFLGFAAGIKTMLRSAKEVQQDLTASSVEK